MCLLILLAAAFSHSLDGLQLSWGFLPQLCKIRGGNFVLPFLKITSSAMTFFHTYKTTVFLSWQSVSCLVFFPFFYLLFDLHQLYLERLHFP